MFKVMQISILSLFLFTGCLETKSETEAAKTQPNSYPAINATLEKLTHGSPCNNGQEGSLTYDISQSTFFACVNSEWTTVNLQGPAGAPGMDGAPGAPGTPGTPGAQGPRGAGALVLKDGSAVQSYLIQFGLELDGDTALVMLPNKDTIWVNTINGKYQEAPGSCLNVYYSEANCAGTAYVQRSAASPSVLNRIYVGRDELKNPIRFFRSVQFMIDPVATNSRLQYCMQGYMNTCNNWAYTVGKANQVTELQSPPVSLQHLAPLAFEPQ